MVIERHSTNNYAVWLINEVAFIKASKQAPLSLCTCRPILGMRRLQSDDRGQLGVKTNRYRPLDGGGLR